MKGHGIPYSEAEMAWLEANRTMIISDYHRAFVAAFDRADVSARHLHALRKRKGWKVGRAPGRFVGRRLKYSAAEIDWLRANCALPIAAYHQAFRAAFGREDTTADQLHALRKREGWKTGRTGRFETGQASHNKGKRCAPGTGGLHPNAQRAHFRKGQIAHNWRGPGYERIDPKEGYVILIVAETNPWSGAKTRPVHKHRWLWEKVNGPVPRGYALKCLDGDKTNTDPSNWEAVHRGVLAQLNGGLHKKAISYDEAPAELKPAVLAVAKLKHQVRSRRELA